MDTSKADVIFQSEAGSLCCYVTGEIDHHTAAMIRKKIDSHMFVDAPDKLVMDMSGVTFMDSSGLGLVLGRYTKATSCGIDFAVGKTTPAVKRMFDMAGLERMIRYENIGGKENEKK